MIKKIKIYGERCSGTNYLEELLINNFNVNIITQNIHHTCSYGHKHFFGFSNLRNSDDVLFIGIVRNVTDWINSLYRNPWHLSKKITKNENTFLNNNIYSLFRGKEIMEDRNIYTKKRYKNIFELRHTKNKFLVEDMPKLVKNYLLITYDDLLNNFTYNMNLIKNFNLQIKNNIDFPLNIMYYKKNKNKLYKRKKNIIAKEKIIKKANLYYEKILFNNEY